MQGVAVSDVHYRVGALGELTDELAR